MCVCVCVCVCTYVHVNICKHTYYNGEGVGEVCDIFPCKFFMWSCGFLQAFLFLTCGRVWKYGLCVQFCFELVADEKAFCKIMC